LYLFVQIKPEINGECAKLCIDTGDASTAYSTGAEQHTENTTKQPNRTYVRRDRINMEE
jgi:hypothetical protein